MKSVVEISGSLCMKPQIGCRAFIKNENSIVADIRNESDCGIEIETKNTIYRVTFSSTNLPVAS